MKTVNILSLIIGLVIFQNCANENADAAEYIALEKTFEKEKTQENVNKLLGAYNTFLVNNKDQKEILTPVLEKALAISEQYKQDAINIYLNALIKNSNAEDQKASEWLYKLGTVLKAQDKNEASDIVLGSLIQRFPSHPKANEITAQLAGRTPIDIIDTLAVERLENPDQYGINSAASIKYVDACEAFALSNPKDQRSPELLFDAAEMAKLLRTNNKALNIYDWLVESYPDYKKTPSALFIKAFILENELNNIELAKEAYELFLQKYPDNDFADDARFSLENLGKSPDEVLKMIEANKQQ